MSSSSSYDGSSGGEEDDDYDATDDEDEVDVVGDAAIDMMARRLGANSDPSGAGLGGGQHPSQQAFAAVLKRWEDGRSEAGFDPTEVMNDMSEVLEKENDVYLSRDPDPFEERHPSRVDPECQIGQLLKTFFRKESLVQDLFNNYLHDKYFIRQNLVRDPFP